LQHNNEWNYPRNMNFRTYNILNTRQFRKDQMNNCRGTTVQCNQGNQEASLVCPRMYVPYELVLFNNQLLLLYPTSTIQRKEDCSQMEVADPQFRATKPLYEIKASSAWIFPGSQVEQVLRARVIHFLPALPMVTISRIPN